jgi:hypothetical protein
VLFEGPAEEVRQLCIAGHLHHQLVVDEPEGSPMRWFQSQGLKEQAYDCRTALANFPCSPDGRG